MSQVVYYTVEMVLYTGMPHYNSVISLLFIGQIMMGGPIEDVYKKGISSVSSE